MTGRDEEAGKNMTTPGLGNAKKTCFSMTPSMDWFKGKFTGNHGFYHQI